MLLIARCAYANDCERRAWSFYPEQDKERLNRRSPTFAVTLLDYQKIVRNAVKKGPEQELTAEFTDDEDSESAGSTSGAESAEAEQDDAAHSIDPEWIGRSLKALSLVNREWCSLTADFRFALLNFEDLTLSRLGDFVCTFLVPHLERHCKQVDLRLDQPSEGRLASLELLSGFLSLSTNLKSLVVNADTLDDELPGHNKELVYMILEAVLAGRIEQLVFDAPGLVELKYITKLPPIFSNHINRLEVPSIIPWDIDDPGDGWPAVLVHLPNLQDLVVGIDCEPGARELLREGGRRAVVFSRPHFITSAPRGDFVGVRTSIDIRVARELVGVEFRHVEDLCQSLWALSMGSRIGIEGHDTSGYDLEPTRLPPANTLPLIGPFPKLSILALTNIETRSEEEIEDSHRIWEVPPELAEELGEGREAATRDLNLDDGGASEANDDGTPRLPQSNSDTFFLFLSSFDSSPLSSISLVGAHLSNVLAHPSFLPFLTIHSNTLRQLVIDSGNTSPAGDIHRRLERFCGERGIRLAFTGTLGGRKPQAETDFDCEEVQQSSEWEDIGEGDDTAGLEHLMRDWS
ncbi:hypothetical protein RQP46_006195 [Phenoliferia psychrophenolica]